MTDWCHEISSFWLKNGKYIMKTTYDVITAQDLILQTISGKINPDPLGQRPPVSLGHGKSIAIVKCLLNGYSIGMITLRDISGNKEMETRYPGVKYLVIDGGHRVRALTQFYTNRFVIDKYSFSMMEDLDLSTIKIPVCITECTTREASEIFKNINKTTDVNFMEMIMSDEESAICREVRSRTKFYKEYNNTPHSLFSQGAISRDKITSAYFDMEPNHRRKWDEYVLIAMIRATQGGLVDAGVPEIQKFVANETLTKTALDITDRFLTDILEIASNRGKKLNTDVMASLIVTWFGYYGINKQFRIKDYGKFTKKFMKAYGALSGTADKSLEDIVVDFDGEKSFVKEFYRKNAKNFSNGSVQQKCFELMREQLGDEEIIFRDEKRSLNSKEREERLAMQGYVCAIDGEHLDLKDSVWGHDTSWAEGGELEAGAVIRKSHNTKMGGITLDQYRNIWNNMKKSA